MSPSIFRKANPVLLLLLSIGLLTCKSPGSFSPARSPIQVEVAVLGPVGNPEAEGVFEQAIRKELTQDFGVPTENVPGPASARLRILVEPLDRSQAVGRTIADAVSPVVYDLSHSGGNPFGAVIILDVYLMTAVPVTATYAELRSISNNIRLGYKPKHLAIRVEFWHPGDPNPAFKLITDAFEVTGQMGPLTLKEAKEPGRLLQEQGRALAVVVAKRLREAGWKANRESEQ